MSSQEDTEAPSTRNSKDAMFEPKPKPKMIRVLTVLAYVLSVSMAAILLSIYYIFMWDGRPHIGALKRDIQFIEEQDNNSYVGPKFVKHIPEAADLSYNASNSFPNSSSFNKIKYHESSTDALRMVNETNDENEVVLNATIIQDNVKLDGTEGVSGSELQQQITAMESEELMVSSTTPTTVEQSVTWSDDYETLEDFKKSNPLIKKLMDSKYYENY